MRGGSVLGEMCVEFILYAFELGYNVMTGTEYFVSLHTSFVLTKEYTVTVNRDELTEE